MRFFLILLYLLPSYVLSQSHRHAPYYDSIFERWQIKIGLLTIDGEVFEHCNYDEQLDLEICFDRFLHFDFRDSSYFYDLSTKRWIVTELVFNLGYYVYTQIAIYSSGKSDWDHPDHPWRLLDLRTGEISETYKYIEPKHSDYYGYFKNKEFPYYIVRVEDSINGAELSGLVDYNFNTTVPPIHNTLWPLPFGFVTYQFQPQATYQYHQRRAGVISYSGDTLIPFNYSYIELIDQLHFLVYENYPKKTDRGTKYLDYCGIIDLTGKEIIPTKYKSIRNYNNFYNLFVDSTGNHFLSSKGNYDTTQFIYFKSWIELESTVEKYKYTPNIDTFQSHLKRIGTPLKVKNTNIEICEKVNKNLFVAKGDSLFALVDRKGRNLTYFAFDNITKITSPDSNKTYLLELHLGIESKIYNTLTGDIGHYTYHFIHPINESTNEYFIVSTLFRKNAEREERYGVINYKGETVLPFDYQWIDPFRSTPKDILGIHLENIKAFEHINLRQNH
ncbi:MAG: WG repeat-containing protein [Flavobacteriales bacterium]|nr:WG repeat-containing protein [Flavobacteriales bacterium]MCB9195755.1 WG repeat-containing protein [Flavobacteriales bacterium]MCB9198809.1 WG repeat-containing protein [Flavobacteriales bacterium]